MMFIEDGDKRRIWHVGEPFPELKGKVVKIQVDGDELEALLSAMKKKERNDIP